MRGLHHLRDAVAMGTAYGVVSILVVEAVAFGYPTGAVFWPGAGLTLGILVRLPRERWPALLTGVFVAEILVDLTIPVSFGVALIWAVANTVEPLVGAYLLTRHGRVVGLSSVSLVMRFVLWAVVVGPLVGATIGATISTAASVSTFWPTWPRWWIGDAIGVLVIAPALFTRPRSDLSHANHAERVLLLAALGTVTLMADLPWESEGWVRALPFLLAPALVVVAMRVGPLTAAIALAASAATVNAVTALGFGSFATLGTEDGLLVSQVCLAGGAFALHTVSALNHGLVSIQQVEELLREQALRDPLTGLANRRMLDEQFQTSLAGLRRSKALLAILMVDLDRFKQLNDQHGHVAGDAALVEVADRLRAAIRPTDTVARIGGDEFIVVLPDVPDPGVAEDFRTRVSDALNQPMSWADTTLRLSASVGLSMTCNPDDSLDDILMAADRSMYALKTTTRAAGGDRESRN